MIAHVLGLVACAVEPSAVLLPADPGADFEVGRPVLLELEVRVPGGAPTVVLPIDLPWPEAWAERSRRRTSDRDEHGPVVRFQLEVLPFEPGRFTLGPFEVEVGAERLRTAPLRLVVRSNLPPEVQAALTASTALPPGQLESLAAPDPEPVSLYGLNRPLLTAILGGLAGLIGLVALVTWWRRRPPAAKTAAAAPPPRPADEVALEKLAALAADGPRLRGGVNPYYTELSEVFRTYLGDQLHFDATELTLDELDDALVRLRLPEGERVEIRDLLESADYAKFARYEPSDEDARRAAQSAQALVEKTRSFAGAIGVDRDLSVAASFPATPETRAEAHEEDGA